MRRCNARQTGSRTESHVPTVGGMPAKVAAASLNGDRGCAFPLGRVGPGAGQRRMAGEPPAHGPENDGVSTPAMTRRFVLSAILVSLAGTGGAAFAAAQTGEASEFIRRLGNRALASLAVPGISLEEREARLRGILREAFDMPFIGLFVLGRFWRQASAEQRISYLGLFTEYVLRIYSARLGGYAGESLTVISERPAGAKDIIVRTRIDGPSAAPIEADWRVRVSENRLRIVDVMVGGVSMVVTQRSEFAAVIQRNGLDGLLAVLRERTAKPQQSGGTVAFNSQP